MHNLPLNGITVLEFSQYLSGPVAGLRLADFGARVIKIERPGKGDACRQLPIKNLWTDDNTLLFHSINRNKESFTADLKSKVDIELVKELITHADVLTHNFRPGVMERAGLDAEAVFNINPRIIYAEISGYGKKGPWKNLPGQDLLVQSMSGLVYTSGNAGDHPVPFGLSIADSICGNQLVQAILAGLIRRHKTGKGAHIEMSLMESVLDFQFELLTTYFASGQLPQRSEMSNGHPLLASPYGTYETSNGFIAIAMVNLDQLASAIDCATLLKYQQEDAFQHRDEIKQLLANHFKTENTDYWLKKLHQQDIWAMAVLDWKELQEHPAYRYLQMEQEVVTSDGKKIITTRCPVRINGETLTNGKAAPQLGENTFSIIKEFQDNPMQTVIRPCIAETV
jgi:crotonobetainyl-CoA:carnitine CoA-transferase CaiB-like acyl-CoA transferase